MIDHDLEIINLVKSRIKKFIKPCDSYDLIENKIIDYAAYFKRWMKIHNISSRKTSEEEIWINIYDSLLWITGDKSLILDVFNSSKFVVDAGAGGGFPGIIIATFYLNKRIELIDISRKKCSFLRAVKARLNLYNVVVRQCDISQVKNIDLIITKAAFSPPHIGILAEALAPEGHLLIWGTPATQEEFCKNLQSHQVILKTTELYEIPNHGQRCLLLFHKPSANLVPRGTISALTNKGVK